VTAGTIFDRTRTPLQEWFAAAWYVTGVFAGRCRCCGARGQGGGSER
jgi:hypothetical protein